MPTDGVNSLLGGYRVLDLTNEKGMFAGKILADMGADVIKVERPGGDPVRKIGPFYKDIPHPEKSLFWFAYNNDKRGITLDIESTQGRDIFKELIKTADVIIESFPVGYLNTIGLDYPVLSQINEQLIMASISPFGQSGPYQNYKGEDIVVLAMGGLMQVTGDEDRAPLQVGSPQVYLASGLDAVEAILIALYARPIIGRGQFIDVSARDGVVWSESEMIPYWTMTQQIPSRHGRFRETPGGVRVPVIWPCKDGYINYIVQGGQPGAERNIIMTKWLDEEGFATDYLRNKDWYKFDWRKTSQEEMDLFLGPLLKLFAAHTRKELYKEATKRVIGLTLTSDVKDLVESPQLNARNYWIKLEHPELNDDITYPGSFVVMSETPLKLQRRAPLVGEHNSEIYQKELGILEQEITNLKQSGII
ncbi:CaiB/BaiF CoA transferase family protein [Chloroflexota bacterium]